MKRADEAAELTRLLAEEPSPLAPLLGELRSRGPDAAQLASLASRLALQGIDVAPGPVPTSLPAWKKWILPGAGGAAAVVVWLALRGPVSLPVAPVASLDAPGRTEPAASLAPPSLAQRGSASTRAVPHAAGVADGDALVSPEPAPFAPEPGRAAPAPEPVASSPGVLAVPTSTLPGQRGPAGAAPALQGARATADLAAVPRPAFTGTDGQPASAGLPSEMQLLRDARLALRQSPVQALELAEQHARLYPQGKLNQERELIAISALVALGRRTAALSRGARFEQTFATSPYRRQVADLLR